MQVCQTYNVHHLGRIWGCIPYLTVMSWGFNLNPPHFGDPHITWLRIALISGCWWLRNPIHKLTHYGIIPGISWNYPHFASWIPVLEGKTTISDAYTHHLLGFWGVLSEYIPVHRPKWVGLCC